MIVVDGDDLIHEFLDQRKTQLSHLLDGDTVRDGLDGLSVDDFPRLEGPGQRGRARGHHPDNADIGAPLFHRRRETGDQPAAPDGGDDGPGLGNFVQDLQADGALARDDIGVIEGGNHCQPPVGLDFLRSLVGVVEGGAVEFDLGAQRPHRVEFGVGRGFGHDDQRLDVHPPGG